MESFAGRHRLHLSRPAPGGTGGMPSMFEQIHVRYGTWPLEPGVRPSAKASQWNDRVLACFTMERDV